MRKHAAMISVILVGLALCACQASQPSAATLTVTSSAMAAAPAPIGETTPCAHDQYPAWQTWYDSYGQAAVSALAVDHGVLWVGTEFGVFRIDLQANRSTLSLNLRSQRGTSTLLSLGDGHLWASSSEGQYYYDGQTWASIPLTDTLRSATILGVNENGDVVLQARQGRSYFYVRLPGHVPPKSGMWIPIPESFDVYVTAQNCGWQAFSDPQGDGLPYNSPQECQAQEQAKGAVELKLSRIIKAIPDADGSLWSVYPGYGNSNQGPLEHWEGDKTSRIELPAENILALVPDPQHGIWLGTDTGLIYTDGQNLHLTTLGMDQCLLRATPDALSVDSSGTAWYAALAGIYTLPPNETVWRLAYTDTTRIAHFTADSGLWGADSAGLVYAHDPSNLTHLTLPDSPCWGTFPFAVDARNVWVSTANCDLWQFDRGTGKWIRHLQKQGNVEQLIIGSDGTVYSAGPTGVFALTGSDSRQIFQKDATLTADKTGGIWIASHESEYQQSSRLWYYKAGQLTSYGQPFDKQPWLALTVDKQNRLWAVPMNGNTLALHDGGTWQYVSAPIGEIFGLTAGPDGRIWVRGSGGIAVYDPAQDKQP